MSRLVEIWLESTGKAQHCLFNFLPAHESHRRDRQCVREDVGETKWEETALQLTSVSFLSSSCELLFLSLLHSAFLPHSALCDCSPPLPRFLPSLSSQTCFLRCCPVFSLFLFSWAYAAKLDTQHQNINCINTKSALNGNYVNINHQSLYFPLCQLKSLLICVTPPISLSLSRFLSATPPPPQTLQMGIQHFSGLFVLLCMGVGGALLTLAGEHTFYHLVIPRLRRTHTLQYWLHTSQVSERICILSDVCKWDHAHTHTEERCRIRYRNLHIIHRRMWTPTGMSTAPHIITAAAELSSAPGVFSFLTDDLRPLLVKIHNYSQEDH